jgi:putative transposase
MKDRRKGSVRFVPHRLSPEERERVYQIATDTRFADMAPELIVAKLAEEKTYIASASTFFRVLREKRALEHRRESRKPRKGGRPEKIEVTGPNQVWSWDITWLKSEVTGIFYYAYSIIDLYDRTIVGWTIEGNESEEHARRLFARVIRDLRVCPKIVHADNGNPMRGVTLAVFLDSLHISRSYSRPRCSNDNAFIESWYRTLKYTVGYPAYFTGLDHARIWFADFVHWYNNDHLHSALGYVTPNQKRTGEAELIYQIRNETLELAKDRNPGRWRLNRTRRYGSSPVESVYRPVSKTA